MMKDQGERHQKAKKKGTEAEADKTKGVGMSPNCQVF